MKHEAIECSYKEVRNPGQLISSIAQETPHYMVGKSCIAWFKISEVLARGEKERTLNIYRLFAHSIQHDALSAQLEGDILYSFNDHNALQAYVKAAALYQKQNELTLAAFLYESIIRLAPDVIEYRQALFSLYKKLGYIDYATQAAEKLIALLIAGDAIFRAHELVRDAQLPGSAQGRLHELFVINVLMSDKTFERSLCNANIIAACQNYQVYAPDRLTKLLATLAGLDEQAYAYAVDCTKK